MAATCRSCGAALPEGAGRCPTCLAIVKPPGFFERLFGGFKLNLTVNSSPGRVENVLTTLHRNETYTIRDAKTGETKVFHSLEEMPEEYREKIKQATPLGTVTDSKQVTFRGGHVDRSEQITFVGLDGVRHTYQSMDEAPESVRKMIEDAKRVTGPK